MASNYSKDPPFEQRDWGTFDVLLDVEGVKVKHLVIQPGAFLSLQLHRKRDEHWFVVSGSGVVSIGDTSVYLGSGGSVTIPRYAVHTVRSSSDEELVLIEIQTGECQEGDIVRLEGK